MELHIFLDRSIVGGYFAAQVTRALPQLANLRRVVDPCAGRTAACVLCRGVFGGSSAYKTLLAPNRSNGIIARGRRSVCIRWLSEIDQARCVEGRHNVAAGELAT